MGGRLHRWPKELEERLIALHATGLTDREMGGKLGMTKEAIANKRARMKLPCNGAEYRNRLQMPDDFPENAHLGNPELQEMYGRSTNVIARWRKLCGVKWKPPVSEAWARKKERSKGPVRPAQFRAQPKTFQPLPDASTAGRAADFLKRYFVPVCKSETLGKEKGSYIVGHKGMMSAADMIALAETKGFDAREWARVAQ